MLPKEKKILELYKIGQFSFDLEELIERMEYSEDWSRLIIAHIYIDHTLTTLLQDHMPNSNYYLKSGHRSFSDKLLIAQSLQLIDEDLFATLKAINKYRNKFAHNLVFTIADDVKINLLKQFSPKRAKIEVLTKNGFSDFLFTIIITTEVVRIYRLELLTSTKKIDNLKDELSDYLKSYLDC